jgi:alkylated DNA repair protein alkB family protein 1
VGNILLPAAGCSSINWRAKFWIQPAFVSESEQRNLIKSSLRYHSRRPNETNLDANYDVPDSGLWPLWELHLQSSSIHQPSHTSLNGPSSPQSHAFIHPKASPLITTADAQRPSTKRELVENDPASPSVFTSILSTPKPPPQSSPSLHPTHVSRLLYKLRWANLGRSYHWGTRSYDFAKELAPFPEDVRSLCKRAVRAVDWSKVWGDDVQFEQGDDDIINDEEWGEEGVNRRSWADDYGRHRL